MKHIENVYFEEDEFMEQGDILANLQQAFQETFNRTGEHFYFSPGRVNLIGEHTDYNGGHVFPCAISLGTYALIAPRQDRHVRLRSLNVEETGIIECSLDDLTKREEYGWANYAIGVIKMLADAGHKLTHGFDILIYGTLPNGAGLSSSASLEVLTGVIFDAELHLHVDRVELVKLAQKAENQFVGVNCGIMDQFAVGMGKENCAILLDCNTLAYRYSPLALAGYSIVITNTNKKHNLGASKYNERRAECEHALEALQTRKPIKALGELTNAEFDTLAEVITNPIERRRARHAVYENQRTLQAVKALEQGDMTQFGKLMNASHVSLRDDYEVTGEELDTLTELAWQVPGVLGSRMTGAGFGGCTVSIVQDSAIADFKQKVGEGYEQRCHLQPSFYVAKVVDGAKAL